MYSVLYVDDEEGLHEVTKRFLEKHKDLKVDSVSSAIHAMEKIRTNRYDAIISDYEMPDINGIEFLKRVRSTFGDIPFILFTGKGREEVVIQAINFGADFYLQKGGEPKSQFAELAHKVKIAVDKKKSDDQLKESQQQMANIINFLPDATFAIDLTGTVIAWNRAIEKMTGVRPDDILGTGNFSYALPFYGVRRPILIDLVLKANKEIEDKYPLITKQDDKLVSENFFPTLYNGKGAYLWFIASPLYDRKGHIIGAIESIRDITEFKKAEQTVRESEANYRGVIESIQDVFYRSDADGNLVLASPSWTRLFGYDSLDECIGKNFAATFYLDPADRNVFLNELTSKGSVDNYEVTMKRRDGTPILISTSSHLYFDNAGNVLGVEGIFRDITDRKRAETLLEESHSQFEAIVHGSPIPTFVIDKDRRVISWNKALEMYSGIKAEQVIGKTEAWRAFYKSDRPCLADLLINDEPDEIARFYQGKYAPSGFVDGAYEATDFFPHMKSGTWLFFTAAPIRDASGKIIGAVEILQDITERKLAEEELTKKNKELNASYEQIAATEEELRQNYDELKKQEEILREKNEELNASYEQIAATEEELRQNYDELKKQGVILQENEKQYRTVFENTGAATVLIDENTVITLANDEFSRITGYGKEEVEGKKRWTEFVVAEDLKYMLAQHRLRRINHGAALKHYEFRLMTKSRNIRTMFLTIDTIPGTKKNVASFLDITERKATQEALRESEQRYRNVVEGQTEFICRFLPNGMHIFVNEAYCRYFNKQRVDIIGKKLPQGFRKKIVAVSRSIFYH